MSSVPWRICSARPRAWLNKSRKADAPDGPPLRLALASGMNMKKFSLLAFLLLFTAVVVSAGTYRKPSAMQSFFSGKEVVVESVSPQKRWAVVFEDDGDTGYFYALDLNAQGEGRNPLQEALHIYNVASITDKNIESVASIIWSADGAKACLLINDYPHAVVNFAEHRGYCRSNFPPPGNWKEHDFEWDDSVLEYFKQ